SERSDWNTPEKIISMVEQVGTIGLDPATDASNPVGARAFYHPADDGLERIWAGFGLVYCNPPYGREIGDWMRKARREALAGAEIIMLVPARPDTAWWQDNIRSAAAVCFWRGRVKFVGAESGAPFPSALIYWGDRVDRFRAVFDADYGWTP